VPQLAQYIWDYRRSLRRGAWSEQKVLNPELVKGPWSKEENAMVADLVRVHGPKKSGDPGSSEKAYIEGTKFSSFTFRVQGNQWRLRLHTRREKPSWKRYR